MKNKILKNTGLVGLVIILSSVIGIIAALVSSGVNKISGREALFSAFGGAFFAYVFVKIGELFTRHSNREKLNLDTLVEIEYTLNDHLNRIDLNIKIVDALIDVVNKKSSVINFMKIKAIPIDKSNLRDMKNLDFINDMFNYYVDLEKINEGLELVLSFAVRMINEHAQMSLTTLPATSIQKAYQVNSEALIGMANDSRSLLKAAEKECVELIAKSKYVYEYRNMWLSLAYAGSKSGHYGDDLKKVLPKLVKELEDSRDKNTTVSKKKIKKILGKEIESDKR